jgi:hypothetical protein
MSIFTYSAAEALVRLEREREVGKPQPPVPGYLPLKAIHTAEALFQPRWGTDRWHVQHLAGRVRAEGHALSPITVWWSGKRWYVLDGHHRLSAYVQFNHAAEDSERIVNTPVEVFSGTAAEAYAKAVEANSKNHLRMEPVDKRNAAWRMVCLANGGGVGSDIARRSGMVRQTVAKMQDHYQQILRRLPLRKPLDLTWKDAMDLVAGRDPGEWAERELESEAQERAERLRASHGLKLATSPEITARALEIYGHDIIPRLVASDPFHDAVKAYALEMIAEGEWPEAALTAPRS